MEVNRGLLIASVCGASVTAVILINSILYSTILNLKNNDALNVSIQFVGLISCQIYTLDLLLVNFGFMDNYPILGYALCPVLWFVIYNCYFIVFLRQSDILLPRRMYLTAWIFLAIMGGIGIADLYASYYAFVLNLENWDEMMVNLDLVMNIFTEVMEFVINFYIIGRLLHKTRHMNNSQYKKLVRKLLSILALYFILDVVNVSLERGSLKLYSFITWTVFYSIKIQTEVLCLGKIKECIIIMERYENA
jgi:hypothetical protein